MYGARGLGLNCPGDPGCPGYVEPGSMDYQTSLLQEILANQAAGGVTTPGTVAASTGSLSAWLNTNATTVALVAGVGVLLLMFGRAGR
jgi:hypothetical protein